MDQYQQVLWVWYFFFLSLRPKNLCHLNRSLANFSHIFKISNTESDPSAIAADPDNLCLCKDGKHQPDCSLGNRNFITHAYPGQEFSVRLAIVGSGFEGVVPGVVRAYSVTPANGPNTRRQATSLAVRISTTQ